MNVSMMNMLKKVRLRLYFVILFIFNLWPYYKWKVVMFFFYTCTDKYMCYRSI